MEKEQKEKVLAHLSIVIVIILLATISINGTLFLVFTPIYVFILIWGLIKLADCKNG